jgi:hypothetical protein
MPILEHRGVAQSVARMVWDHEVAGSSPATPTIINLSLLSSRGALQMAFHHIDLIARPEDRELVADVWRKLGGETVSYE